jgi:anti-sigma B factor antagonist
MSADNFQHIKANMVDDVAVVEVLSNELRFPAQCQEVGTELYLVAGQDWAKKLLVNLGRTRYLCSTGFGVLVNLVKQASALGHAVKFCGLDPEVRIGADIIGLDRIAEIHPTEHEALKAFSSEGSGGPAFAS